MMHRTLALAGALLLLALPTSARAQPQDDVSGVMLQGWYWDQPTTTDRDNDWWGHLSELTPQLREMGFTAILMPPPCKAAGGGFSSGYDIYDFYDLGSQDQRGTIPTKWGWKENMLSFISTAHANGIDVYADIVPNHRSGGGDGGYRYDSLAGSETTGRFTMAPWDFNHGGQGEWDMDVGGLRDISQNVPYVRDGLFQWIRWFDKQTGVDGYRIDAAKHMDPGFIEGLMWQVQDGLGQGSFAFGEFYDANPNTLQHYVDRTQGRSSVYDFTLFFQLLDMAHGGGYYDMRGLRNRFWDTRHSVTFVNTHDTFRRANGLHIYQRTHLAYAVIMAFEGYPLVYWQDLFDDNGDLRQWLANLVWIHHHLAKGNQIERWADQDLYILEREGNLLAGLNDDNHNWRSAWVRTSFGPNQRLHDYALGVGDIWTNDQGWAYVSVPPGGYVMYGRTHHQGHVPSPPARRTTQEYEGAADMDLRPAGEWWSEPLAFTAQQGTDVWVNLYLEDRSLTAHVAIFDKDGNRLNHARGAGGHVYFPLRSVSATDWYYVRIGLEEGQAAGGARTDYFLELDYEGPRTHPGPPPNAPAAWDLLPLRAGSTGP
jgi:alpha-amylase